MRRTNQRFHKRVKVREGIEERLIHAEKLNELLARTANAQVNINLELRGKYDSMNKKVLTIYQTIKELKDADQGEMNNQQVYLASLVDDLQNLTNKVDVMEEVLEDIA